MNPWVLLHDGSFWPFPVFILTSVHIHEKHPMLEAITTDERSVLDLQHSNVLSPLFYCLNFPFFPCLSKCPMLFLLS